MTSLFPYPLLRQRVKSRPFIYKYYMSDLKKYDKYVIIYTILYFKEVIFLDPGVAIRLILLILLLILSAFFSSAETAFTTVSKIRMRSLADEGDKRAGLVLRITDNSPKMLSAILIGNNLVNISASSLATTLAISLFGSAGAGIATGILTLLILIFGEISPKTMATIRSEKMSLRYCKIIWALMNVLTPVIFIINALASVFLRLLRVDPSEKNKVMTERELRTIVEVSHESGVIEQEEKQIINNVFDFGDAKAQEVMVPRIDMTYIRINSTYDEILEVYRKDMFTRLPVCEESTDDIVGILNMKDLLLCDRAHFSLPETMREPYFTYERKNTAELFMEMRESSINIAIVLDDYGTTAGLITLEDLLEEIVGEIRDEYDDDEEDPLQKLSDREYLVTGSMNLEDFSNSLRLHLMSDDYDSIGGYMIGLLDHLPKIRESVTTPDGIFMQVIAKEKHRIEKIYIRLPEDTKEET